MTDKSHAAIIQYGERTHVDWSKDLAWNLEANSISEWVATFPKGTRFKCIAVGSSDPVN